MQQLAHYRIEELLGEGTFAWVYRAFDQKLERYVALKILKPAWLNDPQALARFEREARTLARLHHPNIAQVYDVDRVEGQVFLAQFLIAGETLAARLKRGPLLWTEALSVLHQVAAALDYAHQHSVIHRDLKPANILLGEGQQVYLSDFGLARAAEGSTSLSASSGGLIGTPGYMAPEQWRGEEPTSATDVYALTCVMVEMLTGRVLFDAPTPPAIMTKHMLDEPEFPVTWPGNVPAGIANALRRGLARNPAERVSRAGELAAALTALETEPQQFVGKADTTGRTKEKSKSKPEVTKKDGKGVSLIFKRLMLPLLVLLGGGLILLLVAGIYFFSAFFSEPVERIAFTSDRDGDTDIYVLDDEGVGRLTNNQASDVEPAWSPDGSKLAFASDRDGNWEIYVLDSAGTITRMTNNSAEDREPAWSPDSSQLVFTSDRDGNWEIYTLDSNKLVIQMTNNPAEDREPAYSANGSQLAFASNRDGNWEIYTLDSNETVTRMTNDSADDREPAYSADGSRLAFASNRDGNWEIYILGPDNVVHRVTDDPRIDSQPTWSSSGAHIAFQSNRDGNEEVYVMNTDGNRVVNKTNSTAADGSPAWSPTRE